MSTSLWSSCVTCGDESREESVGRGAARCADGQTPGSRREETPVSRQVPASWSCLSVYRMCAWVSGYTQPSQTHGGCPLQPSPKGQVPSLPAHISCLNRASKSEPHLHQDPGAEARALQRSLRARGPTVLQWALGLPCGVRGNGGRLGLGWQLLSGGCWVTKSGRG